MQTRNYVKDALLGVAVGDALGVPAEFKSREALQLNPIQTMSGYGTHNQPPGTWSDDSSLTFCLADSLCNGINLNSIGQSFVRWYDHKLWTPHGEVFDIGIATREAILKLRIGHPPENAGGTSERSNGNGSLMRILPLLFSIIDLPVEERFKFVRLVSSITHAHARSVIACFYYLEFARLLVRLKDPKATYRLMQTKLSVFFQSSDIDPHETAKYVHLLKDDILKYPDSEIASSGYVVHTLEAAIWCLLTTSNYQQAVLKAVNLGDDTDTTGAVVGGLAGLLYGIGGIPAVWIDSLALADKIEDLAERLHEKTQVKVVAYLGF